MQKLPAHAQSSSTLNGAINVGFTSNPCVSTKLLKNVAINVAAAATLLLVPSSGNAKIYVCKLLVIEGGTTNVTLITGTGTLCGSNTTQLTGPIPLSWFESGGSIPNYITPAGYQFCLINSAAVQVSGSLEYVQQ